MDDDIKKILHRQKVIFFMLLAIYVFVVLDYASAANPHADSVYFNSATDLIAKTDSVIGICDTVMSDDLKCFISLYYQIHDYYGWEPYNSSLWVSDSNEFIITCRELITITVVEHEEDVWPLAKPGQAVIWWRKVER